MSRSLARVEKIIDIVPIEKYDRVEYATVLGWHVIVQKDQFKPGDLCVYVEIDSVMPASNPEFQFLSKKAYRIKTQKMCGVLSQGICFSTSILDSTNLKGKKLTEGMDVTEALGIVQYEATRDKDPETREEPKKGLAKYMMRFKWYRKLSVKKTRNSSAFPSFISKTDETRIQNAPFYLKMDNKYVVTEKVDGQSGTFYLKRHSRKLPFLKDKYEYGVCSRNMRLMYKDNTSYWQVSDRYKIENVLRNMIGDREWIAIQGECIGPSVQGNKYKVTECDLYVFNVIYPTGRLGSIVAKNMMEQHGLKFVPIISESIFLKGKSVDKVLAMAHGTSELYNTLREGLVFRTKDGKQSFKAVDPLFLLKHSE